MEWRWMLQVRPVTVPIAGAVMAADQPVVEVSRGGLEPARIEVHVGEITAGGRRLASECGSSSIHHLNAHEVIERAGEVRAVHSLGEHWVRCRHRRRRASVCARGVVTVRASESDSPDSVYPACAPETPGPDLLRAMTELQECAVSPHVGRMCLTGRFLAEGRCANDGPQVVGMWPGWGLCRRREALARGLHSSGEGNAYAISAESTRAGTAPGLGAGRAARPCSRVLPDTHRRR